MNVSTLSYERLSFFIASTMRSCVHLRSSFSSWHLSILPVKDSRFTMHWYASGIMPSW